MLPGPPPGRSTCRMPPARSHEERSRVAGRRSNMRNIRSRVVVVSAVAAAVALCPGVAASATPDTVTNASADADGSAAQRDADRPDPQDAERRAGVEEAVAKVVRGEATPVAKGGGKAVQVS